MMRKLFACALFASVALTQPILSQPVLAQSPFGPQNMSEEEVSAFVRVAMPSALVSLQNKCRASLPQGAYIYSSGSALHARLSQTSRAAWPGALGLIRRAASQGNPAVGELMSGMPPEVLQPLVDEMVASMVSTKVEEASCPQINRALELLDPLPAENLADLIGFAYAEAQKAEQAGSTGVSTK